MDKLTIFAADKHFHQQLLITPYLYRVDGSVLRHPRFLCQSYLSVNNLHQLFLVHVG